MQNKERLVIVGYSEATITNEFISLISEELDKSHITVVNPKDLIPNSDVAYIISITRDINERKEVIDKLADYTFATFVHNSVVRYENCIIGKGTFIAPFCSIFYNATINSHCIIGPYSMISHNAVVGIGSIIHPGVMIAGGSQIGNLCLLGIRSTVIDKITICDNVFVGANALVTKNITEPGNYVGTPCRKVLNATN